MALTQAEADAIAQAAMGGGASESGLGWSDLPSSSIGAGWGAGKAGWMAGLGAVAQALGFDTGDFVDRKQKESEFYQRNAPGATTFFGEGGVTDDGKLTDWLAYNFGQSAPYVLEMLAGGLTGAAARGAVGGGVRALGKDLVVDQAARTMGKGALTAAGERELLRRAGADVGTRIAAGSGAALASYPSAVGDILLNQREAGGEDFGAALAGGVPYALLNLLGGEAAVLKAATGGMGRAGTLLKTVPVAAAKAGVTEGIGETGQELINQAFGRMAVSPDETLTSGNAPMRYAESFMAGLGLGAPMGGVAHVFAKPQLSTPEEIAARKDSLRTSLDFIERGVGTDLEVLEQGKKNEEQFVKRQQEAKDAAEKAAEDAFYAQVEGEEKAKKEKTAKLDAVAKLMQAAANLKKVDEDTDVEELVAGILPSDLLTNIPREVRGRMLDETSLIGAPYLPYTPTPSLDAVTPLSPEQQYMLATKEYSEAWGKKGPAAKMQRDAAMSKLNAMRAAAATPFEEGSLFNPVRPPFELTPPSGEFPVTPPAPATPAQVEGVAAARGGNIFNDEELYNAVVEGFNQRQAGRRAGMTPIEQLAEEMLAREAATMPVLNRPKPPVLRTAMEEALLGALKPLQEDASWKKFLAEKDAQRQAEMDAAFAQQRAAPPVGKELLGVQGDLVGFPGMTPEEIVAGKRDQQATAEVPDLADFNEWQAEGLQISADWEKARAAGDTAALARLEQQAQALYERAALGFPKAPGTTEMFQLREGEDKPRVTPAGRAASGNWFKQPKEKASAAQTAETKQAEPAAPAVAQPAAAQPAAETPAQPVRPDLNALLREKIARDELAQKLADKFNQRKTLTAEEAKRVLDDEAEKIAVQPTKEIQNGQAQESPVPAQDADERQDAAQEETLPELNAAWNVRKENRGQVEKAAREWNEQYGNKFQYPELDRDLQLLVKHAIEAVEKQPNGRTQSKMTVELADRIELEQEIRNREERGNADEIASPAGIPVGEQPISREEVRVEDTQREEAAPESKAEKEVAPRTPEGEMGQITARIADLEAKQEEEYLPGRAELLDRLYDRAARLEEKAAGLREQQGMTAKEVAAESVVVDDEMQEVVEPHSFGKVKGSLANDTTPDYPENEFIGGSDTPWVVELLKKTPTIGQLLDAVGERGDPVVSLLAKEIAQLVGISEVQIEYSNTPEVNERGKRVGGRYDPTRNRVFLYAGGATEHTVMHEVVHAVTMHRIEQAQALSRDLAADKNLKLTSEQQALLDTYSVLSRLRIEAAIAADKRGLGKMYGLQFGKNGVAEFVAEAMSNPGFQQFLKSVPSAERSTSPSIWGKFVNAVKHILGLTKDELESVLARVLELTPGLVATRRESNFIGTRVLENTAELAASLNPVSGTFVNQTQTASTAIGALARVALDNAPMMARSAGATVAKMARSVLDWTHTQRGAAMIHPQLGRLVSEASDMLRTKEKILTRMNELQREFLVSQRPVNWKGELSPVGKYVNEMLEATLNYYSEGIPKPLLDRMSKVAKSYLMDDKVLYTDDAFSGMKRLIPSLEKEVMLPAEEFRKGIKIAKQDRTISVPEGMSDEAFDKAYAAYKSAMLTMADSHIQKLVSAEVQALELMEGEVTQLPRRYKGEALKSMTALRNLYAAMYTRISELDMSKDKTTQADSNVGITLERTSEILHGLARGVVSYESGEAKLVADNLGVSLKQLEEYMAPLVEKYNDAGKNDKVSVAKNIRNDIVGAARISRVKEARVYTAVKELFGMYVPARRTGEWTIRLKLVDQDGNDLVGTVKMADGTVQETGAVLDVIQFGDGKLLSEGESILTQVHNDLNKQLAEEGLTIDVDVQSYDSVGKPVRDSNNIPITKSVKAKLAWTKPERTRAHRSVAQRLSPIQMKTNLEVMGITLTAEQQERMVIGLTNQEATVRGRLMRHFVPGYSTDFKQVLADYLGSVASSVALSEHGHRLQLMAAPDADGWNWSKDDEAARVAMEKRVKDAKTGDEKVYWQKEADRLNFNKNRIGEAEAGLPKLQDNAREYIEYILGQDQLEEKRTGLTKARSIVTILQLGGTLASPLTNLSSIPLHTFSYLSSYNAERAYGGGFSASEAGAAIIRAVTNGAIGKTLARNAEPFVNWKDGEIWIAEEYYRDKVRQATETKADVDGYSLAHWQFLQRAASEGVLGAQKHNELLALRKRAQFGPRVSKAVSHYMALFAATEEYNRTVTGLASFDLFYDRAIKGGASEIEAAAQAYDQAVKTIYDTQGEYNQINRPKLFRSDLGSLVFLYKTFVITTLEMLRNLPPKGRAIFLGSLYGMSGSGGLPLLDEFWLVLDVAAQKTGLGLGVTKGNAERAYAEFARDMGEMMGWEKFDQVAMRGVLDTYLGTELFGRAGVQVGIPMAGMLRPGAKLMEEIGRSLGAFGGAVEGAEKASDKLIKGDFEGAFRAVPITAVKNFADAYSYAKYDAVVNKRGQVVTKFPGPEDILARAAGFYPSELKWVNDQVRREEYTRAYAKEIKTAFTEEYREAYIQKDNDRMREVVAMVRTHNESFRGTALEMPNFEQTAKRSGKEAALTLRERAQKTLSKAQQQDSALKE